MRKVISTILIVGLCMSFIGCGNSESKESQTSKVSENSETSKEPDTTATSASESSDDSFAAKFLEEYKTKKAESPDASIMELADALIHGPSIEFDGEASEVTPGPLVGFSTEEITGFKEGVIMAPLAGSIGFLAYIFTTDTEDEAQALAQTLKDAANPRWLVCIETNELVSYADGNQVFFLMYENDEYVEP